MHRGGHRRFRLRPIPADERGSRAGYNDAALDGFAKKARAGEAKGDVYVFMINGAKVGAPAAALALQERLR